MNRDAKMLKDLVETLARLFEWTDTSPHHALLHVENAVHNLRADLAVSQEDAARLRAKVSDLKARLRAIRDDMRLVATPNGLVFHVHPVVGRATNLRTRQWRERIKEWKES
jgi:hypothetical protein